MRSGAFLSGCVVALAWLAAPAHAQSPAPAEPGRSATDGVTSPTTPPATVAPPAEPPSGGASGGITRAEIRELIEAAQATAKATREMVDYNRVTPDILTQILAKLDKLEDKLDKVEAAVKGNAPRRR